MKNNLSECVAAFKDVRRNMQRDANSCVSALDEAIAELERVAEGQPTEHDVTQAVLGAFAVVSKILACATDIEKLVKAFGG
jgi:hypothetical protein